MEAVALAPQPPKLKQVSETLDLNITTCYHLVNTLIKHGYIDRDDTGSLRIGTRAGVLNHGLQRHFDLGRILRPVVEELAARTQETAYFSGYTRHSAMIQIMVGGTQAVQVAGLHIGFSGQEHLRSSGMAIMAHLDAADRRSILDKSMADLTVTARKKALKDLDSDLDHVRNRGYAVDMQRFQESVCGLAAPVFRSGDTIVGAVAITAPSQRFAKTRRVLTEAIVDAGREASKLLEYY